jgi:hypothetical protein
MNIELRHIELQDWIAITLMSGVLLVAITRWFSSFLITDLLSSYFKDRFINLSKNGEDGSSLLIISSVAVYIINLSLFIYLFFQNSQQHPITLEGYILTLTLVSVCILLKHFLGKLVATLCSFEELLFIIDHRRNIYRAMFAYLLIIINCIVIYGYQMSEGAFFISLITITLLLFLYNLILIYTYRSFVFASTFYFILYLCTFEIAPYLLLYKYIML